MCFLTIHVVVGKGYDMKIAAVQMSGFPGDVQGNLQKIRTHVQAGAEAGCRLLLFPEISDLGYDMPAIARHGLDSWPQVREYLLGLAAEFDICLVCGVCLPGEAGLANALVAFGPQGTILREYRKIHLFQTRDANETRIFSPGGQIACFELDGIRFGLSICYDLRFPELYRVQALEGCQVLLLAAAWPKARIDVWKALCTARALENQCYLLGANRIGDQGAFPFGGHSLFIPPSGEAVMADPDREGLICGIVDPANIDQTRRNIPAFSHRRPDLYAKVVADLISSL